MTASLGRSAPACCIRTIRSTSSARGGVFWKSWLEQTTFTPAAWAAAIHWGRRSPAEKNSMSSRSAQPEAQTAAQKAAYWSAVRAASPPSAWVRKVTSSSFSPSAARSPRRQRLSVSSSSASANQSARHSTQSAELVENAAAFCRMAASVRSTMGTMTLGRPSPMQQRRMVIDDMADPSLSFL